MKLSVIVDENDKTPTSKTKIVINNITLFLPAPLFQFIHFRNEFLWITFTFITSSSLYTLDRVNSKKMSYLDRE
jgi:nitric oxide reductase large subunit